MCQSGQANTAGKGSPVIPQQLGHTVLSRARPTEKPGYTQRRVNAIYFVTVPQCYIISLTYNLILPLNIIFLHAQFCGSGSAVKIYV